MSSPIDIGHPDIDRVPGPFANRSRAVVHRFPGGGRQVWALATARDKSAGAY